VTKEFLAGLDGFDRSLDLWEAKTPIGDTTGKHLCLLKNLDSKIEI
jgi:hypothetical protein